MAKLPDDFSERYDLQIGFLDSLGKPGAATFQSYRESKVLAVGAGSFLVSLVAALLESGLLEIHEITTDSEWTMTEATVTSWREKVRPFDWILYVDKQTKAEEIRAIHTACRAEKKNLLTATCMGQTGFAGPLVNPDSEGCWESAWRRLHHGAIRNDPTRPIISPAAERMLANIIVFDMFRTITRVAKPELENRFLLLDLHTLEGSYHSFFPHPLVGKKEITTAQVENWDRRFGRGNGGKEESNQFLSLLHRLTSPQSGILHLWDEGDLSQLPLSQCRVQAVDPLSEGPAELLPVTIRAGLTHLEARKEAGIAGIEAYLSRLANVSGIPSHRDRKPGNKKPRFSEFVAIGVGETAEEAVYRGLQKCLTQQLRQQMADRKPDVLGVRISDVRDLNCRYCLQALTTLQGAPTIGFGEDLLGFPVAWIGTGDCWYGCVGLNKTLALRMALQQALLKAQNRTEIIALQAVEIPSLAPKAAISINLEMKAGKDAAYAELIHHALSVLKRTQTRLFIFEVPAEPFWNEHLGGLFGVMLGEEEEDQGG